MNQKYIGVGIGVVVVIAIIIVVMTFKSHDNNVLVKNSLGIPVRLIHVNHRIKHIPIHYDLKADEELRVPAKAGDSLHMHVNHMNIHHKHNVGEHKRLILTLNGFSHMMFKTTFKSTVDYPLVLSQMIGNRKIGLAENLSAKGYITIPTYVGMHISVSTKDGKYVKSIRISKPVSSINI